MAQPHVELDLGLGDTNKTAPDLMEDFEQRAGQIERDTKAAVKALKKFNNLLSSRASTTTASPHIESVESLVSSIRAQLASLAQRNKDAANSGQLGPASLKIRVNRFGALSKGFLDFLGEFESAKDRFRDMLGEELRADVVKLDPALTENDVNDALGQERKMDAMLQRANPELRYQVEDLRARNRQLEKLNRDVAQVHELFVELSFLTETQQSLINEVEHNVGQTKQNVVKADEEIIEARRHQKSARKKKFIIAVIILIIIGIIAAVLAVQLSG